MTKLDIEIVNTSYHKKMTDRHLAQVNFTAWIPEDLAVMYFSKTTFEHQNLGRIRFMENTSVSQSRRRLMFGRVSHGYGYDISQDIENAITYSKGVKK